MEENDLIYKNDPIGRQLEYELEDENEDEIEYELIRSKRRSISLEIKPDGELLVRAPNYVPKWEIDEFIFSKRVWIEKNRKKTAEKTENMGEIKRLSQEELSELMSAAKEDIPARVRRWAPTAAPGSIWDNESGGMISQITIWDLLGNFTSSLMPGESINSGHDYEYISKNYDHKDKKPKLTIRHQKTLWGSCTPEGSLSFNCMLMLAPEEVRDYVVIHELCHLNHMDHSREFWKAVGRAMPDYKKYRKWLSDNGYLLLARLP